MANKWSICLFLIVLGWSSGILADDRKPAGGGLGIGKTERIDVWYVTLRNRQDPASEEGLYGALRGHAHMGISALEFTPIPGLGEIADAAPFYIPDERQELQSVEAFSRDQLYEKIQSFTANKAGRVVVYVHGYNVGFEKACRRAAIFQRYLLPNHRLLLFSWPADGNLLAYTRDEADLEWSVPKLAALLVDVSRRTGVDRLDVVGHSLGARGVVMALSRIACRYPTVPLVNELILVAPDIDTDCFRQDWPDLRHLAKRTTLYVSENDKALGASRQTHGYPRLGEAGEHLTLFAGMQIIDVSPAGKRRYSGHIYHLYHPDVAADLMELLNGGRAADQRDGLQKVSLDGKPYWRLAPAN